MSGLLDPPLGADDHVTGDAGAAFELVMYGDFECPYCAAAQSILARVRERLGADLRFAFRHMPFDDVHPLARRAAEAAEAAAAQGAFWPMHDALYAARGRLADRDLLAYARDLALDDERVAAELRDGVHAARVQRDLETGRRAGVTGTPGFFVNGRLHEGAYDAGSLIEALRAGRG
jgi:protein-disulfide isomerase